MARPYMTILTKREQDYVRAHWRVESCKSMADRFGVGKGWVSGLLRYWGFKKTKEDLYVIRSNSRYTATHKEDNYIIKHYIEMSPQRIADRLGRSEVFVKMRMQVLELVVPREVIEQRKADSRLKSGHVPWNKGRKMSKTTYKKTQPTMFKKGNLPPNTLYDGAITIRKDNRGVPEKRIRLAKGQWEYLSRYNYEKFIGPIPAGMIITFRDGDTMNCEPDNLVMMTKAENMARNTIHNYPAEIKSAIHTLSKLKKKIKNATEQD